MWHHFSHLCTFIFSYMNSIFYYFLRIFVVRSSITLAYPILGSYTPKRCCVRLQCICIFHIVYVRPAFIEGEPVSSGPSILLSSNQYHSSHADLVYRYRKDSWFLVARHFSILHSPRFSANYPYPKSIYQLVLWFRNTFFRFRRVVLTSRLRSVSVWST